MTTNLAFDPELVDMTHLTGDALLEALKAREARRTARNLKELRDAATPAEWLEKYNRLGRNEKPWAVESAWLARRLDPETFRVALADAWVGAEYPLSWVRQSRWLEMFAAVGYLTDEAGVPQPTEPLTIYRGAGVERRQGMSWTTEPDKALWFARYRMTVGGATGAAVYRAVIHPAGVLARFNDRDGEHEVVVNPRRLRSVETYVGTVEAFDLSAPASVESR